MFSMRRRRSKTDSIGNLGKEAKAKGNKNETKSECDFSRISSSDTSTRSSLGGHKSKSAERRSKNVPIILSDYEFPARYVGQVLVDPQGAKHDSHYNFRSRLRFDPRYEHNTALKVIQQVCLVLIWFCLGLSAEIVGPTLPDIKRRNNLDYEQIAQGLAGKSVGGIFGSIVGGFLNELYFDRVDQIVSLTMILVSICTFAMPYSNAHATLVALLVVAGFAESVIGTGGHTMVMHLWKEKAASPMHSLHFGLALGALIAPFLARPFMKEEYLPPKPRFPPLKVEVDADAFVNFTWPIDKDKSQSAIEDNWYNCSFMHENYFNLSLFTYNCSQIPDKSEAVSEIEKAYIIVACLDLAVGIVAFFIFYITAKGFRVRKETKLSEMMSLRQCAPETPMCGLFTFIILFLYFANCVGAERILSRFLFTYCVSVHVRMSKTKAAMIQSSFWAAFALGRLTGIFSTRLRKLTLQIFFNIILHCAFAVAFLYIQVHVNSIWFLTSCMAFFISAQFPNGMSWANLNLKLNCVAVMFLMMGSCFGALAYQYITGYLFELMGPRAVPITCMWNSVAMSVCFSLLVTTKCYHVPNIRQRTPFPRLPSRIRYINHEREENKTPDIEMKDVVAWHSN